jgi:alkylation response protein AidB-like acyl-CoA dehydrogenase
MQSTARRSGAGYVLNGQKVWISDADTADFLLVFAKTDPKAGNRGVSAFMLDRAQCGPALRTEPIKDRLGIRAGDVVRSSCPTSRCPSEIGSVMRVTVSRSR